MLTGFDLTMLAFGVVFAATAIRLHGVSRRVPAGTPTAARTGAIAAPASDLS